jgi:hypothetical protein
MTDIVERLRREGRVYTHMEAADEIERLRAKFVQADRYIESLAAECYTLQSMNERLQAERDRMREALRYWLHDGEVRDFGEWFEVGCKIARAALKETGHE